MSDERDELDRRLETTIEQYQAMIEKNVREQIARHHHVDPTIDRKRIVEIQIRQERERLERMADRLDDKGGNGDIIRELAGDWLSELEHRLKYG